MNERYVCEEENTINSITTELCLAVSDSESKLSVKTQSDISNVLSVG